MCPAKLAFFPYFVKTQQSSYRIEKHRRERCSPSGSRIQLVPN